MTEQKVCDVTGRRMLPIADAPRDGSRVVLVDNGGTYSAAQWLGDEWVFAGTREQIGSRPQWYLD